LTRPKRPLSRYDFKYLHQKFFGAKDKINHKDFDAFWEWFGKVLQRLRYQRHIGSMWQAGYKERERERERSSNGRKKKQQNLTTISVTDKFSVLWIVTPAMPPCMAKSRERSSFDSAKETRVNLRLPTLPPTSRIRSSTIWCSRMSENLSYDR
jgi:hypothetical protein